MIFQEVEHIEQLLQQCYLVVEVRGHRWRWKQGEELLPCNVRTRREEHMGRDVAIATTPSVLMLFPVCRIHKTVFLTDMVRNGYATKENTF